MAYPAHIQQAKENIDKAIIRDSIEIALGDGPLSAFVAELAGYLELYPDAAVSWESDTSYTYYDDEYEVNEKLVLYFDRPMTPKELVAATNQYERLVKDYKKQLADNKAAREKEAEARRKQDEKKLRALVKKNPELAKQLLEEE